MVYNWDQHRLTCRRLYVDEDKSLDDLMHHLSIHHGFSPSRRALQQQIRKWCFPPKRVAAAHRQSALVDRARRLWESNRSQADMLETLHAEGFQVSTRQLLRLRSHHRLLLRVPKKPIGSHPEAPVERLQDLGPREEHTPVPAAEVDDPSPTGERRHRAHTREATLAQSKEILGLDQEAYRQLRQRFGRICLDSGLHGKRKAGSRKWEDAKSRLAAEMPRLGNVLPQHEVDPATGDEQDRILLALDAICIDVTKRTRGSAASSVSTSRRPTLAEARNTLSINPDEARRIRGALLTLMAAHGVTSKLEAGGELWDGIKHRWRESCPELSSALERASDQKAREEKFKAEDALARDVVKRFRDEMATRSSRRPRDQQRQKQQNNGSQGPSRTTSAVTDDDLGDVDDGSGDGYMDARLSLMAIGSQLPQLQMGTMDHLEPARPLDSLDSHMDSSLLFVDDTQAQTAAAFVEQQYMHDLPQHVHQEHHHHHHQPAVAIYLQPHHGSTVMVESGLWIGTLGAGPTLHEVRSVAVEKYPGALCALVEGVVRDPSGQAGDMPLPIESDQELAAYLQHVREGGAAPTFSVQLHYGLV